MASDEPLFELPTVCLREDQQTSHPVSTDRPVTTNRPVTTDQPATTDSVLPCQPYCANVNDWDNRCTLRAWQNQCWGCPQCDGKREHPCGQNGNNYGAEITRMKLGSSCACSQACSAHATCQAWTYVPDGRWGMFNDCVLRSELLEYVDNCDGTCLSGPKPDNLCGQNGNNYGPEITRMKLGSSCACSEACSAHATCQAWTYVPNGRWGMVNDCVLRSELLDYVDNCDGTCLSGPKRQ